MCVKTFRIIFFRIKKISQLPVKTTSHHHPPPPTNTLDSQSSTVLLSICRPVDHLHLTLCIVRSDVCLRCKLLSQKNPFNETLWTLFLSQSEPHKVWKPAKVECWKWISAINKGCSNTFWNIFYLAKAVRSSSYNCAHLHF